ncbi:hypothetical protein CVCC1112_1024 [Paenarthrobacter nicotinovorans]|nr:hypothetical protein CVCC1112_1024 [Paenarthrobacter nicotinovorans]
MASLEDATSGSRDAGVEIPNRGTGHAPHSTKSNTPREEQA